MYTEREHTHSPKTEKENKTTGMMDNNQEYVQLLNTAIIKSKEKKIDSSYEQRLSNTCSGPAVKALGMAVKQLSDELKISHDQAAVMLVETVRELDSIWSDYVMMEGISKLKELLQSHDQEH